MLSNLKLEIINNILDISKIESNKLEIEEINFKPKEEFLDFKKILAFEENIISFLLVTI